MSKKKPVKKMNVSKGVEKKHLEELDVTDEKIEAAKRNKLKKSKSLRNS